MKPLLLLFLSALVFVESGCAAGPIRSHRGAMSQNAIVIAGNRVPIDARVILWSDPGGFNGYENGGVQTFAERDRRRDGEWDLKMLQETIDQFVIHYDGAGSSAKCFEILKQRNLSVHFMIDVDGTIYQTLDVKERAWHATRANSRSVGVELASTGAYPVDDGASVEPDKAQEGMVIGQVQGKLYRMQDFTPRQYASLIKLTAALCSALPRIACDYPRDRDGHVINHVLTEEQFQAHHGLIGHYHIQPEKQDPGPAFQWDRVARGARALTK